MTQASSARDPWPFTRQDPQCVILPVRPGVEPSGKPPVRIFLGTEEAQYRAERIFFYSIEKVRDPARVYEIHLMKNVRGFDRSKWRTGFTNYRYAIPEFAGGTGRAIYNDVDQIYLADPALLFDLDMGEHGYLAISAKDTSVMLIDCARMIGVWNRKTAASQGKHALINTPAATPGLWGRLDGHWNARDLEYVEGLTKCLHYTALHQQPWQPFPEVFSYHPNPLAYVWHDLEREADAQGYGVFDMARPSPDFAPAGAVALTGAEDRQRPAHPSLRQRAEALGARSLLVVHLGGEPPEDGLPALAERRAFDLASGEPWPEGEADVVVARDLIDHLPPADIPWLLDALFERARKLVHVELAAIAPEGLGSAVWWRKRMAEAGQRHPAVDWHLEIIDRAAPIPGTVTVFETRRVRSDAPPSVWVLADSRTGNPAGEMMARALGWSFDRKTLVHRSGPGLPRLVRGPSLAGLDRESAASLASPWPDLVIAAGAADAPVAAWIRRASGGRTRVVQLGRPEAPLSLFDLVVTSPEERLPIRDNVLHVTAPLVDIEEDAIKSAAARLKAGMESVKGPHAVLIAGPGRPPYGLTKQAASELAGLVAARRRELGGTLFVHLEPGMPDGVRDVLMAGLPDDILLVTPEAGDVGNEAAWRAGLVLAADHAFLLGDDPALLAVAAHAGKPVDLHAIPRRVEAIPGSRPVIHVLTLLAGGGTSYRGTPHQQHFVARAIDRLVVGGAISLAPDPSRLHRSLVARGLASRLGDATIVSNRKPLDDVQVVAERIRRIMSEAPVP